MRAIVTGGAGFIGSHVAAALLAADWEVEVIDDLSSGRERMVPAGAALRRVDIRDADAVRRVFESFRPDVVSHHAAQASVSVSAREPILDAQVNVLGTINLLSASVAAGASRFVFASTGGAIYGEVPAGKRAGLDTRPAPASPYACAKLAGEAYLESYRALHGLSYTILRYANVYGPAQNPHGEAGVVAIFAQRLLRDQPISVFARAKAGDDGCVRDYVYVDDVVDWNLRAIRGAVTAPISNVATGVGTTTRELAEAMKAAAKSRSEIGFAGPRTGDLERSVLEPERDGRAPVPLDVGLRRTLDWFREHRDG
ncbi:MAG TPA: NAD-dependent epimerase/dehydratase family protein [Myxococcota bacterium]|nr:NAD-dependent epimerase/dehydratase family protein [Myxococcota bacterium]